MIAEQAEGFLLSRPLQWVVPTLTCLQLSTITEYFPSSASSLDVLLLWFLCVCVLKRRERERERREGSSSRRRKTAIASVSIRPVKSGLWTKTGPALEFFSPSASYFFFLLLLLLHLLFPPRFCCCQSLMAIVRFAGGDSKKAIRVDCHRHLRLVDPLFPVRHAEWDGNSWSE